MSAESKVFKRSLSTQKEIDWEHVYIEFLPMVYNYFHYHTSAHTREDAGADSIWWAIRSLRVDRIGHGTRA